MFVIWTPSHFTSTKLGIAFSFNQESPTSNDDYYSRNTRTSVSDRALSASQEEVMANATIAPRVCSAALLQYKAQERT
jgi:hypothetical protein